MLINCNLKLAVCGLFLSMFSSHAAITVHDYNLTKAEFTSLVNKAANQGDRTLKFKAGTYRIAGPFVISKRINIVGAGRDKTILLDSRKLAKNVAIFNVNAAGVSFNKIQIKGGTQVKTKFPFGVEEGSRVTQGIEIGIDIGPKALDLRVLGCKIYGVNVGINAGSDLGPSGLQVKWTEFSTGRGMILGAFKENFSKLQKKFIIEGVTFKRDTKLVQPDPGRGVVFDFGLVNVFRVQSGKAKLKTPVDLRGSIIKNCKFPRMSNWNVGMTRVSNVYIDLNKFNGGGAGNRDRFCHSVHLEDVCRNVYIRGNNFTQAYTWRVKVGRSHIWGGGFGKDNSPRLIIQNHPNGTRNQFFGDVTYSLGGTVDGWSVSGCRFNNLKDSSRPNKKPEFIINGNKRVIDNWLNKRSDNLVNGKALVNSQIRLLSYSPGASTVPGGKNLNNYENDIVDSDLNSIAIYPNTSGDLHIDAPKEGSSTLSIFNMQGQEVMKDSFITSKYTITSASLVKGVYIMVLETSIGTKKAKFIVD